MAVYAGRNASVKLGTNLVRELGAWSITMNRDEIDTTAFGSTWAKSEVGMAKWTARVEGYLDISDTTGQQALFNAYKNATLITNIKFFVDNTSGYVPDITADSNAGCRISSYEVSTDKAGVAKVTINFAGQGPIALV